MRQRLGLLFSSVLSLSCMFVLSALAQQLGSGVVSGEVSDPQSAIVRNAQISVSRKDTGVDRRTSTNAAGLFAVNNLAPGTYELHVTAAGFADYLATIHLEVGQAIDTRVRLGLKEQKEIVDINDVDTVPLVETTSSTVDGVINSQQIDNLPLNGRNFLELALLTPGNTIAPNFDPTKGGGTVVISSAGQLGRGGNVSIDGMDDNDDVVGGMLLNVPEDAVQEFQVATNRFSAELGRSGSAVVNVATKSGSNTLHGSASVYERDKSLQAAIPVFNPTTALAPPPGQTPPFRRQQYSGTLGGPLVKDKAWFFGAFEYRNELGGVLAGTRQYDSSGAGSIVTSFASEPLTDPMGTVRGDWKVSSRDDVSLHYSIERLGATGAASFLSGQPIGSLSERQDLRNNFQTFQASWARVLSPTLLNRASFHFNNFFNSTVPLSAVPELDFPSLADGSSYRVPQQTRQKREQFDDSLDWVHGKHNFHFGGEFQRIGADFNLGVFQQGVVIFAEDFPVYPGGPNAGQPYDRNGDGVVNDKDLVFAVAIRSDVPDRSLIIPDADNNHSAAYFQDDWRFHPQLTLNLGLRYEIDSDVNNLGHYGQINPILQSFLQGSRHKAANNWGPRVGFNWATKKGLFSVHGGYGIYYDRITLEIDSLERGLDGRALPIDVHLGNLYFTSPQDSGPFGTLPPDGSPGVPSFSNPFVGPIIPGAGGAAEGINIIDNRMRNPMVQQFNLGVQYSFAKDWVVKVDGIHNLGTHFIIGVPVGSVFNPDSGGPETVTSLQSSVNTHYDALWAVVDHRFSNRFQFHSAYTFSKSLNYANYDQIPFGYPPVDPSNLHREYGPAPNDQTHRLVLQGTATLPFHLQVSPLWTYGSGVPMDILLGDGSGNRVPGIGRNAGGRQFHTGAELNSFLSQLNAAGELNGKLGTPLPMVSPDARFNDTFNSFDLRLSREFHLGERFHLQAFGEAFNLFNKMNILGTSNANYSGFFNVLRPDQNNVASAFGRPASSAGGVFGSGGPRAFQLAVKLAF